MDEKPYQLGLTIGHGGKGIPYGGFHDGETNDDGSAKNRGFKNLKGNLHRLSEVPELDDDTVLRDLIAAINHPDTGLVSVGCANWRFSGEEGHRWEGYVEFAINSVEWVNEATNYFVLFFKFDKLLHECGFSERVNYHWELEGADFSPAKVGGFTCTVWVRTPFLPSPEEAKEAWQQGLEPLIPFLGNYPKRAGEPLFTAETDCDFG